MCSIFTRRQTGQTRPAANIEAHIVWIVWFSRSALLAEICESDQPVAELNPCLDKYVL